MRLLIKQHYKKALKAAASILLLFPAVFMTGCTQEAHVDTTLLSAETAGLPPIRYDAIKRTAMTYGAQTGLAFRSRQINHTTAHLAKQLDSAFNFTQLLLSNNIIPPVLTKASVNLNASNPFALRTADATYRIISPAHFVTAAPTWRDYLHLRYKKPPEPNPAFLPKNEKESDVWQEYVQVGWKHGIEQANDIFEYQISLLKRDYSGMALYRNLLAQNMITTPEIEKTHLGVTGGGQEIRVNDRFSRIVRNSSLKSDSKSWRPVLHGIKNDGSKLKSKPHKRWHPVLYDIK